MTPSELFQAGKLKEAVEAQLQVVKNSPANNEYRLFFFELVAFTGDLERADRQLQALTYDDPPRQATILAYRNVLKAEATRRKVLAGEAKPKFLGPAVKHAELRVDALMALKGGDKTGAMEFLRQADEQTPLISATLNDKPIDLLRDCDDVLGSVLEVCAHGEYYWLALDQIDSLTSAAPKTPRDFLWIPVNLAVWQGPAGEAYLPNLYNGSHLQSLPGLQLGRSRDWTSSADGPVRGIGAKQFLAGEDAVDLLDWRQLTVNH